MSDEDFEKPNQYQLKQIHQEKLNLTHLTTEVQKLTSQGFPEKRAKEIYALSQVTSFFKNHYQTPLLPGYKPELWIKF